MYKEEKIYLNENRNRRRQHKLFSGAVSCRRKRENGNSTKYKR